MKWLFVTTEFPWPLAHGTWLRVYNLIKALISQGDEVSILCRAGCSQGVQRYVQTGASVLQGPAGAAPRRGKSRCLLGPYVYDRPLARCVAESAGEYDVVVLVRPGTFQYAIEASAGRCVVADMVDDPILEERRRFWHDFGMGQVVQRGRFIIGEHRYERTFIGHVSSTVFVSEADAQSFSARHRSGRVVTVPNGVDTSYFERPSDAGENGNGRATLAFVGNMSHVPNADAAQFIVREIAPLVWQRIPETYFTIVGCDPPVSVRQLDGPRVNVTGTVDDVRPMLWQSSAVVLPMRIGTGIKNKLLEAWASSLAVVATPLACQGIPACDGENLMLGQTPEELAEAVVRVIEDETLRRRLADGGRQTVEDHLTWSIAAQRLRAVAADVM